MKPTDISLIDMPKHCLALLFQPQTNRQNKSQTNTLLLSNIHIERWLRRKKLRQQAHWRRNYFFLFCRFGVRRFFLFALHKFKFSFAPVCVFFSINYIYMEISMCVSVGCKDLWQNNLLCT